MRSYTHDLNRTSKKQRSLGAIIAFACLLSLGIATPAVAATASSGGEALVFTRADLNNDGRLDLVCANLVGQNRLYLGDRDTVFRKVPRALPDATVGSRVGASDAGVVTASKSWDSKFTTVWPVWFTVRRFSLNCFSMACAAWRMDLPPLRAASYAF